MAGDQLWLQDHPTDLNSLESGRVITSLDGGISSNYYNTGVGGGSARSNNSVRTVQRSRLHVWLIRLSSSILLWTCLIQLMALAQLSWHPHLLLLKAWPSCLDQNNDIHFSKSNNNAKFFSFSTSSSSSSSLSDPASDNAAILPSLVSSIKPPLTSILSYLLNP